MSTIKFIVASLSTFFFLSIPGFSQKDSLSSIIQQFDVYARQTLQEKIFVHTDRSFYLAGETMWFKIYCTDGILNKPLTISKVAYLEIIDKNNKAVLQTKISLENGLGNGSLVLIPSLSAGNYLVRVYTNWMKNFDPGYFFEKPVTIVNTFKTLGLKPVKDSVYYDIQFFPEGGNLVEGIQSKVAFKITDITGKGADVKGYILNQKNDTIARFKPARFGIGNFLFTPVQGNEYKAIVRDGKRKQLTYPLPHIQAYGYAVQLDDIDSNQLKITVNTVFNANAQNLPYLYLVAHTRQVVKMAEVGFIQQGKTTFIVNKQLLGEGISHFTLFNADKLPVAERLFFKPVSRRLLVDLQSNKTEYSNREKITVNVSAKNAAGKPEMPEMSMAVFLLDSLQSEQQSDIFSYVWLTSDLKGNIESPGYYFSSVGAEITEATDNLMLTHGWSRFRWKDILNNKPVSLNFIPEYAGHIIRGRVIDSLSKLPASGVNSFLSSPGKYIRTYPSKSNANGYVQFEMKNFYGSHEIIAQANAPSGRTYRVEILNPFAENFSGYTFPKFDMPAYTENKLLSRSIDMQTYHIYIEGKRNTLNAVSADSSTFYGRPDAKYMLDDYTRFKIMEDVLKEYVPGVQVKRRKGKFHFMVHNPAYRTIFEDDPLVLLDGVPIIDTDEMMAFDPLKIKKLEVVTRKYFIGSYNYSGIVSFTTYKGDMANFPINPRWLVLDYEGLQSKKDFYAPKYETQNEINSRLPDFRNLLFWSPDIKTGPDGKKQLDFFSSDKTGKYMAIIQGMTAGGLAGSGSITFEIKKTQ